MELAYVLVPVKTVADEQQVSQYYQVVCPHCGKPMQPVKHKAQRKHKGQLQAAVYIPLRCRDSHYLSILCTTESDRGMVISIGTSAYPVIDTSDLTAI